MPVMIHGYFDADLWKIFTELSYFYRQICAKQVLKVMMQKLEKEITVLVCNMKKYSRQDGSMRCNICWCIYLGKIRLEDLHSSGGCIVKKEN
jgi:hypothetical protein